MRTVMVPVHQQRAPSAYPGINGQAVMDAPFDPEAAGLAGHSAESSTKQAGVGIPQGQPTRITSAGRPQQVYQGQQSAEAVIQQLSVRNSTLEQERERIILDNRALKAQVDNARGTSVAFDFLKLARGVRAKNAVEQQIRKQSRRHKSNRGAKLKGVIWDTQQQRLRGEAPACWLEHLPCCGENGELRRRLEQADSDCQKLDIELQEMSHARHEEVSALSHELDVLRQQYQQDRQQASSSQAAHEANAAVEAETAQLQEALRLIGEQRAAEVADLQADLERHRSESENLRRQLREAQKNAEEFKAKLEIRKEVHLQELGEQQRLVDHLLERTKILSTELEARESELTNASSSRSEGRQVATGASRGASTVATPSVEVLSALAELQSPAMELMGAVGMTLPTPSDAELVPWIRALSANMARLSAQLRRSGAPTLAAVSS